MRNSVVIDYATQIDSRFFDIGKFIDKIREETGEEYIPGGFSVQDISVDNVYACEQGSHIIKIPLTIEGESMKDSYENGQFYGPCINFSTGAGFLNEIYKSKLDEASVLNPGYYQYELMELELTADIFWKESKRLRDGQIYGLKVFKHSDSRVEFLRIDRKVPNRRQKGCIFKPEDKEIKNGHHIIPSASFVNSFLLDQLPKESTPSKPKQSKALEFRLALIRCTNLFQI